MSASAEKYVLHHIGMVVPTLAEASAAWQPLGWEPVTPVQHDPNQQVRVQFFRPGAEVLVELIEPANGSSPVSNFLKGRGGGLHHLCYAVTDVDAACVRARADGAMVTCPPVPAVAFGGRRIAFVYWHGLLLEFLEVGR